MPIVGWLLMLALSPNVLCVAPTKAPPKQVSVADFKIRVADEVTAADWSQGFQNIAHLDQGPRLQASDEQRLQMTFSIVDSSGESIQPQQVFVRLASPHKEVILIPEADNKNVYKLDVDLKTKAKLFHSLPDNYELSLIVGDSKIKSFMWTISEVELKFSLPSSPVDDYFARKPDIVHTFRKPEKRPPVFVSNVFCFVILGLFGLMLVLWMRIGISMSGITPSSLLFQVSLGAILYIEYLFYLGNNMFTTLRFLTWTAPFALYFGRRMLANLAKSESQL
ncbi:dolichyl-diphosphooligosaccharide--protein glycosyltransferase subunit 2-like [Tropilaelaps mercedesae]|uniref:Dolichyl-diphosphooligosaccharide--protein glycosyltransferase subunit 2 n=1 Tax=Tropilaelaps mercedesae TaxID=418985 RepID=A0A1V9XTZ3_9ACAR|nr:dolichyl-diphosphooligosaccharide--protein glycosyltransferase subunit 2-like [Tropilaelaps mercedesae]